MIDPLRPVEDPADFYGRRGTVRRIFSRIGAGRPQSVAVIGGARSGKTSLLNYIAHPTVSKAELDPARSYRLCRVDCRGVAAEKPESFFAAVGSCLSAEAPEAPAAGSADYYDRFKKAVEAVHRSNGHLVFLMDDFHCITGSESFPLEFFSFLRSMANNYNVAYVTTSFLELQKLCVVKDIEESPFFNIFTNLSLGLLERKAAVALLASAASLGEDAARRVVDWCGASPYLLKLLAMRLAADPSGSLDEDVLEKTLFPHTEPYFEEIVSMLSPQVFSALRGIAKGRSLDPRDAHLLRPLVKQGFFVEEDGTVEAFSPAFGLFLKSRLNKKMLRGKG